MYKAPWLSSWFSIVNTAYKKREWLSRTSLKESPFHLQNHGDPHTYRALAGQSQDENSLPKQWNICIRLWTAAIPLQKVTCSHGEKSIWVNTPIFFLHQSLTKRCSFFCVKHWNAQRAQPFYNFRCSLQKTLRKTCQRKYIQTNIKDIQDALRHWQSIV